MSRPICLKSGRDVEVRYTEIVQAVCGSIELPVAVKLTPYLSSIGHFAATLVEHGAAGLVLFNRLLQPDIDLLHMSLTDSLDLSEPAEDATAVLLIAILAGRTKASLAASTGVSSVTDVGEIPACRCRCGYDDIRAAAPRHRIHGRSYQWPEYVDAGARNRLLADMRGMMSWQRSIDRSAYTRTNYLRILEHAAYADLR